MKRFFKGILKFIVGVLLLAYTYMGLSSANYLATRDLIRRMDVSVLHTVISEALPRGEAKDVTLWLRHRKKEEAAEIAKILYAEGAYLNPDAFFDLSSKFLRLGKMEEAVLWGQFGRYRLRYDVLRCGVTDGATEVSDLVNVLTAEEIDNFLAENPQMLKKSLQWVMDLDEKVPARNSPRYLCRKVGALEGRRNADALPEAQWPQIRDTLRATTLIAIKTLP